MVGKVCDLHTLEGLVCVTCSLVRYNRYFQLLSGSIPGYYQWKQSSIKYRLLCIVLLVPVQQCCQLRFSKYLSIGDLTCCQFFLSLDNFSLLILVLFFFSSSQDIQILFFRLTNKLVDLLDMLNKNIQSFLVYCPILKPINVR